MSPNHQGISPDAEAVIATELRNIVVKHLPSAQATQKQGDQKLALARELAIEYESVIAINDRRIVEDRITRARELRVELDAKSGISKFLQARQYHRAARDAYRYAKFASDKGMDTAQFQFQNFQSGTTPSESDSGLEEIQDRTMSTARSLYRCFLSCKDAFPTPYLREDLAKGVWDEACLREGAHPNLLRRDGEFECSSMEFLSDIKMKIMHAVESLYGFDTNRAPDSNARRALTLLTKMTFIYRELNFGGRPYYPYRHPIIQKVINITWFRNIDDDGILFYFYFSPIPIEAIGLALTVIECCIDEWSDGTWKESSWSEERYEAIYRLHINSLHDLRKHNNHQQGGDLLAQIQFDLLKDARKHAGAPPDPITGAGRFPLRVLEAAAEEDLPAYDQTSGTPGITVSEA